MDKKIIKEYKKLKKIRDNIYRGVIPDSNYLEKANNKLEELNDNFANLIAEKFNITNVETKKYQYRWVFCEDPSIENPIWKLVKDKNGNFVKHPENNNIYYAYRDKRYVEAEKKYMQELNLRLMDNFKNEQ